MLLPRMIVIFLLKLALASAVFFGGGFHPGPQAQDPSPTPSPEKEEPADDRIYSAKEVDVKAKVIRILDDPPKPGADCARRMRLVASLGAVLRKSGKVTEAEILKDSGCRSYDEDALRVVRNVRFNPALKDDRPVSQYLKFEFQYSQF